MNFKRLLLLSLFFLFSSASLLANSDHSLNLDIRPNDWSQNYLSRYVTEEEWQEIVEDSIQSEDRSERPNRRFGQGQVLTVDTRDQKNCSNVKLELERNTEIPLNQLEKFCDQNKQNPYSSVVIVDGQYRRRITFEDLPPEHREIARQTRNFAYLGAATLGVLWFARISNKVGQKQNRRTRR